MNKGLADPVGASSWVGVSGSRQAGKGVNMHIIPRNGDVTAADHASPYKSSAWTTAVAIVRERMAAAKKNADEMSVFPVDYDSRAYAEGRYHALRDCLEEMEERGKS